jgi:hypothetical protein
MDGTAGDWLVPTIGILIFSVRLFSPFSVSVPLLYNELGPLSPLQAQTGQHTSRDESLKYQRLSLLGTLFNLVPSAQCPVDPFLKSVQKHLLYYSLRGTARDIASDHNLGFRLAICFIFRAAPDFLRTLIPQRV